MKGMQLPDIGGEAQTSANLKQRVKDLQDSLNDEKLKCKALQRNFESLSSLLMKAESEKAGFKKIADELTEDVSKKAGELLE